MSTICLFADDGKSAKHLVAKVSDRYPLDNCVGVALFPEALCIFKDYGLKSIVLDEFITRPEHERNGIEASNYIFQMGQKLGLEPIKGISFHFESFDLLHSFHFVNYEIIGHIFYYLTTIPKVLDEIKPEKVYAVDLRVSLKLPVNQRARSLFTKCLINAGKQAGIPVELVGAYEVNSADSIPGLDPSCYKSGNNLYLGKLLRIVESGFYGRRILDRVAEVLATTERTIVKRGNLGPAVLYFGNEGYFRSIIRTSRSAGIMNICLNYLNRDSESAYFVERKNVIRTNMKCVLNNFLDDECLKLISEYEIQARGVYEKVVNNSFLENNFNFKGICFFNVFLGYLKLYIDNGFSENLKIYLAVRAFSNKFNVKFALGYCGWTSPESFSVHEALKANNVITAFMSHGMNVVNKNIAPIVRGDGTLYPCDVFFSPGSEMVKRQVECGLKDNKNNFVTGFPHYSTAKRSKGVVLRRGIRKIVGLDSKKKIILYPLSKGTPHVSRPNAVTFFEEYNFVKRLIEKVNTDNEFQLVVKSKHQTIPDRNFLKLFQDNYPNVVLRYGPLKYFLKIADVVINFHSSSGFDALLTKVPVIYFKPSDRYDWFHPYASTAGEKNFFFYAKSFEEIMSISRNIANGSYPKWYKDKIREARGKFMILEGDDAAKKVMKILSNYLK